METKKLYYENCHLSRFTARVQSCCEAPKGWEILLDATAFYPEGGGQAADRGTLGQRQVLHVSERGEQVVHLCDGPLEAGSQVEGRIDYAHRFDLMQQHTGEHIVSGIINRRYGYHNVGFHMSSDVITIDFDGVIPSEDLPGIEKEANEAIWQNLPVVCTVPSEEELPHTVYRTKRALPWPVRIVQVPGYDSCACCGVHVAATGEIGVIKLLTTVGFRGGTRMEMLCGKRAWQLLNTAFDQNRQVSQAFSAQITETGAAARRMNEQLAAQKFQITQLQRERFDSIAKSYQGSGTVIHFEAGLESGTVRELCDAIADRCGGMAAVFSGNEEAGYFYCLVTRSGDLRQLGKDMNKALNGRGGGKPQFLQGRVQASKAEIKAFFN